VKPRLLKAGFFWRSNDPADIIVGESSINDVVCVAPTLFPVAKLGYSRTIEQVMIRLSELEFLVAGLFGADRTPTSHTGERWNGSARRYGVYVYTNELKGTRHIVILANSLHGANGIMFPETATEAWESIFYGMKPAAAWDICDSVIGLRRATIMEMNSKAEKEETDAASNKAGALRHRANTNKTTGPQNLQGLHKEATVRDRAGRVEGGGSPSGEGQGHEPLAPATAL
jgi:hypothetical protein